jgi:hypothetical protein
MRYCPPPISKRFSPLGVDLNLTEESKKTISATGDKILLGGKLILGGLIFVGVSEIVGHRFMRITSVGGLKF